MVHKETAKPEIASGIATALKMLDEKYKIQGVVATIEMDKEKIAMQNWPTRPNETDKRIKDIGKNTKKATDTI